jgi:hypothetical protein
VRLATRVVDAEEPEIPVAADPVDEAPVDEAAVELPVAVEAQETAVGRFVTPETLQNCWANWVAFSWSATSQAPARQQAISLKKLGLEQIHAA